MSTSSYFEVRQTVLGRPIAIARFKFKHHAQKFIEIIGEHFPDLTLHEVHRTFL